MAAVARKAETTKYGPWVTQAQNWTRAAPGPREQMVSQDGSNKSTAEIM